MAQFLILLLQAPLNGSGEVSVCLYKLLILYPPQALLLHPLQRSLDVTRVRVAFHPLGKLRHLQLFGNFFDVGVRGALR
jgi:hypothetical protein